MCRIKKMMTENPGSELSIQSLILQLVKFEGEESGLSSSMEVIY